MQSDASSHSSDSTRDLDGTNDRLTDKGVVIEPVRIDETTGCRFTFFSDPDGLPIELYEVL
ncbi:VOC family protein [Planktomarina temperata]|nr:VOC family protein [Planktomarina temperata]